MALANLQGRVAWVFEDADFDIDQIIGIKNIKIQDLDRLAELAMRDFDPEFRAKTQPGDLLVGNHNSPLPADDGHGAISVSPGWSRKFLAGILAGRGGHGLSPGRVSRDTRRRQPLGPN